MENASSSPAVTAKPAMLSNEASQRRPTFPAMSQSKPTVILMAGLQGSGKTTATAKLALHLKTQHASSVGVAASHDPPTCGTPARW